MKACGLVVEYNPFHFGHLHHVQQAKKAANADCIIAVMSGSFLQRGEPAIIDKFHRTKAAIQSGVDILIELPYAYSVQSSKLFAEGAVKSLAHMGVDSICFGSESGTIDDFLEGSAVLENNKHHFEKVLHAHLDKGDSFPVASQKAYQAIGLQEINLVQPNNILGFSYVRAIRDLRFPIEPMTIPRIKSHYHDAEIKQSIASATSIRKEIKTNGFSEKMADTLPAYSLEQLKNYQQTAGHLHDWEMYFPFLKYQVMTKDRAELKAISGVDEGLEYRLQKTVKKASSLQNWIQLMKTKRYTQTRLQRCFVHLLTSTSKQEVQTFINLDCLPYVRLLGLSQTGREYLNKQKKQMDIPIYTNLNQKNEVALKLDEKAQQVYYATLSAKQQKILRKQEFQLPMILK